LELLNQQITAGLKLYLERLEEKVRQRWRNLIPSGARAPERKQGSVTIEFSVHQDGAVTDRKVVSSSGDLDLDEAALSAVSKASPFSPLPSTTKKDHLLLRFHFEYNPAKPTGS
jgi:periplasmic protein TonB